MLNLRFRDPPKEEDKHSKRPPLKEVPLQETKVDDKVSALADHRNTPTRGGVRKILMTKLEAKKAAASASSTTEVSKEATVSRAKSPVDNRFYDVVLCCEEYRKDIEDYIFAVEKKFGVEEDFLHGSFVTPKMRAVLVDWLVQVHTRFDLVPETLYLTINLLDRYLTKGHADKNNLQLIGVTCLSIAAKYEEVYPPELQDYVFITEEAFSKKEILCMEKRVLTTVGVDLGRPPAILFLRRISEQYDRKMHAMAKYICEHAICDYSTCHLNPSVIGAVSAWLSTRLETRVFTERIYDLARVPREVVHQWAPVFAEVVMKMSRSTKLTAINNKYRSTKNLRVAFFSPSQIETLEAIAKGDKEVLAELP